MYRDPLNISPSFKYANERRLKTLNSFEIMGGGDSSEDSDMSSGPSDNVRDRICNYVCV